MRRLLRRLARLAAAWNWLLIVTITDGRRALTEAWTAA